VNFINRFHTHEQHPETVLVFANRGGVEVRCEEVIARQRESRGVALAGASWRKSGAYGLNGLRLARRVGALYI